MYAVSVRRTEAQYGIMHCTRHKVMVDVKQIDKIDLINQLDRVKRYNELIMKKDLNNIFKSLQI
jgi:hypothetical protein